MLVVTSETVVVETVDFAFSQVHDTVGFLSGKGFLKIYIFLNTYVKPSISSYIIYMWYTKLKKILFYQRKKNLSLCLNFKIFI